MTGLQDFMRSAARYPLLSEAAERHLGLAAHAGDPEARRKLVEHNIRLAVKMANEWRNNTAGVELDDLVQEAILGLQFAANKFDPNRGFRFSTYATRWIGRQLWNAVHQGGPVRYSDDVTLRIVKVRRALRAKPSASVADLALTVVCTEAQAAEAAIYARSTVSLDDDTRVLNVSTVDAPVFAGDLIDDVVEADDPSEGLDRALEQFRSDPVAMRAISMRFGLDGGPWTGDQIAEHLAQKFGIPVGDAKRQSQLATRRFRRALERERANGALPVEPADAECARPRPGTV